MTVPERPPRHRPWEPMTRTVDSTYRVYEDGRVREEHHLPLDVPTVPCATLLKVVPSTRFKGRKLGVSRWRPALMDQQDAGAQPFACALTKEQYEERLEALYPEPERRRLPKGATDKLWDLREKRYRETPGWPEAREDRWD